jgi:hypothetical protein
MPSHTAQSVTRDEVSITAMYGGELTTISVTRQELIDVWQAAGPPASNRRAAVREFLRQRFQPFAQAGIVNWDTARLIRDEVTGDLQELELA